MTELLSGVETPSDAELISRVRGGDAAAYGELFSRHVDAARRLGRQLVRGPDADDLVSEAFAKTLQVLQGGGGPDVAFRAYLLTSVRRLHVDRIRAAKKVQPSDDMSVYDDGQPFQDTAVANFENGAAARAFSSLPERWQLVLWHLEVEGQKPADIAPLLGMSANSVSALAYRAREGLRQAFLTMHLADCATEDCRWVNQHLGAYVRNGLSRRDTTKVQEHLDHCRRCTAMYLELSEVNSDLAGIIAPLLLGAAAAGYLSSGGAGLTGVSALFGRVRDAFGAETGGGGAATTSATGSSAAATGAAVTTGGAVTAGGVVAAGVAAVATAALVLGGGGARETATQAEKPSVVQTPTSGTDDTTPADRAGSPREKGADGRTGTQDDAGPGDVVVVAKIEPADPAGSGNAPAASSDSTASGGSTASGDTGGQSSGSGSSADPAQPAPGDGTAPAPEPQPQPQPQPDPGPGSGPIVPPVDLPDPLPDTPQVPSDNLPGVPPPGPALPDSPPPGPSLPDTKPLPGDPVGGGTGTTPGGGTGTDTGTPPGGDTGTPPGGGTGSDTGGGTGTDPGSGTGGTPGGNTGGGTGTDPGSGTGSTPGGDTGTTPGGGTGTDPGGDTGGTPGGNTGGGTGTDPGGTPGGDTGTNPGGNADGDTGTDTGTDTGGDTGGDTGTNPDDGPGGETAPEVSAELADGAGQTAKILTVTVTGAPAGEIVLELVTPDGNQTGAVRFTRSQNSCELEGARATCRIDAGAHKLTFDVTIPPGQVDKTQLKITFKDAEPVAVDWAPGTLPWPFTVGPDAR